MIPIMPEASLAEWARGKGLLVSNVIHPWRARRIGVDVQETIGTRTICKRLRHDTGGRALCYARTRP